MIKVANKSCVCRLGFRAMKAARVRNTVAALAIALTTVLFTSLFTIAASIDHSYQQENFRRTGGDAHGAVKNITWEQAAQLRQDPLLREAWCRLFVGMPHDPPFHKSHVEVSYIEPGGAAHHFCTPVAGTLPQEGTDQAATDTRVLALLGVEPKVGARFTLPITLDEGTAHPHTVERTFTLCGWWEHDSTMTTSNLLVPRSAAEEICALSNGEANSMTGVWELDVMFGSAVGIRENLDTVLENQGYQCTDAGADNYLDIGVNWGYTGARATETFDAMTFAAMVAILLLILFTGYLIIYNVFQISVTNDIRSYGQLKTIGTTGKQIRQMILQQALLLSLAGIPVGLLLGFLIGNKLTPVIMAQLSYKNVFVSFDPWIFIGAAAFSLLTVLLSCARPGRLAAKVSPVEAVRYTEGGRSSGRPVGKRGGKRAARDGAGASLAKMAWANLGRSKSKTVVTVLSLALAVVLMDLVYTFAGGFDMEKYLSEQVVTDFVLGHTDYFQTSANFRSADQALSEEIIAQVMAQGGITEGGRIYGQVQSIQALLPEAYFRQAYSGRYPEERSAGSVEHTDEGTVVGNAQLYGLEDLILGQVTVLDGDLAPLSDPGQNAVAAVYAADDYGRIDENSNCFEVGDTVKLRYVEAWVNVDVDTGEEVSPAEADARYERGEANFLPKATRYTEKEYTVCAKIKIPRALTYRYSILGGSALAMGAQLFRQDTGMDAVMLYAFNTAAASDAVAMEDFLQEYTTSIQPTCDYESKQSKVAEFEGFRNMFLTMGGTLAGIIGLVGVLNFINAVLTGILARKRELAMLRSVGMTAKQMNTMLVYEGLYYTMLSLALSLALSIALGPQANALCYTLWFFTYRFTVLPVLLVLPLFLALGALVPLWMSRREARRTIIERLREAES